MPSPHPKGTILLVANFESDVGYAWWLMENFWHLIAVAAKDQGRHCLLVYPQLRGLPEVIRNSPIEAIEFKFNCRTWADIKRGVALIRSRNVQSIYLTDWPYFHPAYLLWRLAGVKRIVMHDHSGGDRPALAGARAFLKDCFHFTRGLAATTYVAVSPFIAQRLWSNCRVPASRRLTVTNGIAPFACDHSNRMAVRERLGIPADAVLIVMVSRATTNKNIDFAIDCVARLLEEPALRGRVYALHCGDGPDLDAFTKHAAAAGIAENFRFLGRRSDVHAILCAADIAFHPSKYEAMSLAILEFMNAELAVLTADIPSVSAAIEVGVTGQTYRRDDLDDACAQLRRLIDGRDLRKALGVKAREVARDKYSLDRMNQTFIETVIPAL